MENKKNSPKNRREKSKRFAIITIVVFTLVILLLNIIAAIAEDRFALRKDISADQRFTLTEPSREFLAGLEGNPEIIVLAREEYIKNDTSTFGYTAFIYESLIQMKEAAPALKVRFVDVLEEPALLSKYSQFTLESGDFLVINGDKVQQIKLASLFNTVTSEEGFMINSSGAEQLILSSLKIVSTENPLKVGFITGFNEFDASQLSRLFALNAYEVEQLSLLSGKIDESFDILILPAPETDFSPAQVDVLSEFMDNEGKFGKTLIYFASIIQDDLPNIEGFLAQWGMTFRDYVIAETDVNNLLDITNPLMAFVSFSDAGMSLGLNEDNAATLPFCKPIEFLYETKGEYQTAELAYYSDSSYLYPLSKENTPVEETSAKEEQGPFTAIAMTTKTRGEGSSFVMALGSTTVIEQDYLNSTLLSNGDFFVHSLDTLYQRDNDFILDDKVLDPQILDMSVSQAQFLGIIFIVVLPLATLIVGFSEWRARKKG